MKIGVHPTWYADARVQCACGNTFTVGSTRQELQTEICANCHPLYTGKAKLIDAFGRVDQFKARLEKRAARRAQ